MLSFVARTAVAAASAARAARRASALRARAARDPVAAETARFRELVARKGGIHQQPRFPRGSPEATDEDPAPDAGAAHAARVDRLTAQPHVVDAGEAGAPARIRYHRTRCRRAHRTWPCRVLDALSRVRAVFGAQPGPTWGRTACTRWKRR